jgi:hypothetical protein
MAAGSRLVRFTRQGERCLMLGDENVRRNHPAGRYRTVNRGDVFDPGDS